MLSFLSKKDDNAQATPGKSLNANTNNSNDHHQQQVASNRTNNGDSLHNQRQLSPRGGGSLAAKSRMFYKNKKLSSSSQHVGSNTKSHPNLPGIQPRTPQQEMRKKRHFGGGNNKSNTPNANDDYLQDISVNETSNGIEVSFPGSESTGFAAGSKGKSNRAKYSSPVISLKDQIRERQRVFKTQFSTVLPVSNKNVISATNTDKWKPTGHRIPLLGIISRDQGYSDALHLLKNQPFVDERTAVEQELSLLETEISSLERDRIWLEQSFQSTIASVGKYNPRFESNSLNKENLGATRDAQKLLRDDAIRKQPLTLPERNTLQKQRGNSLTIHLSNSRVRETFVLKFGGKQHNSRCTNLFKNDDSVTTIVPSGNSSTDTGVSTLQHLSIIPQNRSSNGGLYILQDAGKSQSIGQLPNKLSQRFGENESIVEGHPSIDDLRYLSTGSRGCYFAKFQSGECWWGSVVKDIDFQNILTSWDVYRVAFGQIQNIDESSQMTQVSSEVASSDNVRNFKSNNVGTSTNSWIILSHDGKAAWKNLPSRLSTKLESRLANSTVPVEVSLGPGDSYFIRFLDGSIDYSLPSKIARVCERIEERGGKITNISLHPDISHDFVIRHTELTRQ